MIAHVDLDSFFVAVERARRPDLAAGPLIIGGRPGSRGVVVAASRDARRARVQVGMPLHEAALRCPTAAFLDGSFDAYFAAARRVDELLRGESREIEWRSIDEAFVALPASRDPGDSVAAVERIQSGIRTLGFDAACGLARNKLVARVASRLAHPRGVVHVLAGYETRFLSPLKIDMLPDLEPRLLQRLRGVGVRRLGQIVALKPQDLSTLAGRAGAALAEQARGIDRSRVRRTALPPGRLADRLLDPPTCDDAVLRRELRVECERLGRDLRLRRVYATALSFRARFADGGRESRTALVPQPSALDDVLFEAAVDLWRSLPSDRAIRAISLAATGVMTSESDVTLFPLPVPPDPSRPARLPRYTLLVAGKKTPAPSKSPKETRAILQRLRRQHPDADTALHYRTPFELLVATILSAQCTDERVNQVTPALFARYPDAAALSQATTVELEPQIQSTGFFRAKSKSLLGMAKALVERHAGSIPPDMAALTELPGVGRKTANVVLGHALGVPGLPVDRHVLRVANRIGIARSDDPELVEKQLNAALKPMDWTVSSDTLILHGRRICKPRPLCEACSVAAECDYYRKVIRPGSQPGKDGLGEAAAEPIVTRDRFERLVEEAVRDIPPQFQEAMKNVAVVIEDEPSPDILEDLEVEPGDTLFGLYQGTPLPRAQLGLRQRSARSHFDLSAADRILVP